MATTTNYAWETPDDTDLVKDGAAAIRTLGSSVDTTTKALNPSTTLGDIEYRSSTANTNTRLPIGTSGQILAVSGSGVPEWVTSSAGTTSYTLLNAGGTALTGASTITVSGISNQDKLFIVIDGSSSVNSPSYMIIRFNGDTGSNYYRYGYRSAYQSAATNYEQFSGVGTSYQYADNTDASDLSYAGINVFGAKGSGVKIIDIKGVSTGRTSNYAYNTNGYYDSSSAISSVSAISTSGNFDAGIIYVYGSTN